MPIARHLETYHITSIFNSEEGPVKKISNEKILHSPLCSLDVIRGGKIKKRCILQNILLILNSMTIFRAFSHHPLSNLIGRHELSLSDSRGLERIWGFF